MNASLLRPSLIWSQLSAAARLFFNDYCACGGDTCRIMPIFSPLAHTHVVRSTIVEGITTVGKGIGGATVAFPASFPRRRIRVFRRVASPSIQPMWNCLFITFLCVIMDVEWEECRPSCVYVIGLMWKRFEWFSFFWWGLPWKYWFCFRVGVCEFIQNCPRSNMMYARITKWKVCSL